MDSHDKLKVRMELISVPLEALRPFHLEGAIRVLCVCDDFEEDDYQQRVVKLYRVISD